MPVVGHDAVRKNCHVVAGDRVDSHCLERTVVGGALEKNGAFRGAIEHMKRYPCRLVSDPPRHGPRAEATSVPLCRVPTVLKK